MESRVRILHIIPDSAVDRRYYYLGSTKDVLGRTDYFNSRSIKYDQLVVKARSDDFLLEQLSTTTLTSYSHIIVELPIYLKSIRYIKKTSPNSRIYCRPINAEFYHKIHAYFCKVGGGDQRGHFSIRSAFENLPMIRDSIYRLKQDFQCGHLSDVVLSITEWESIHYWKYLVGNKVRTLPYFLPAKFIEEIVASKVPKQNLCVSFLGVKVPRGSFLADSLTNFCRLCDLLEDDFHGWSFKVTGELPAGMSPLPRLVEATGFLESPYPLLAQARAVAILSNYGFGFKTKILEAILCGCYILVPFQLQRRLPKEILPFCIGVDLNSVDSFKRALTRSLDPFPEYDPNFTLREEAFRLLDDTLH